MSRAVMPRVYKAMIRSLDPSSRAGLAHDLRLERPVAVPGHRQVHRAHIGEHGLGGRAVAAVGRPPVGSCFS
jgi:hypothetical protein